MTDDRAETLLARVRLGMSAEDYLELPMTKWLILKADEYRASAHFQMEDVNPTDHSAIARLQVQANVGKAFEQWIIEAINDGRLAEATIRNEGL